MKSFPIEKDLSIHRILAFKATMLLLSQTIPITLISAREIACNIFFNTHTEQNISPLQS